MGMIPRAWKINSNNSNDVRGISRVIVFMAVSYFIKIYLGRLLLACFFSLLGEFLDV